MTANIVAVVGENENGILRTASRDFMALLEPYGIAGHIVDLFQDGWESQLGALSDQGIMLAWGPAGCGAALEVDGQNAWAKLKVPFISVLADSPCIKPSNHYVASRFVANGYQFQDWLAVQQRFIRAPQLSTMLPIGIVPNPKRDLLPWPQRPRRMVLVKTGADPDQWPASWANLPPRLRGILHDASAEAFRNGPCDITDFVLGAAAARNVHLEGRIDALFGLMQQVDGYVRSLRSTSLVRALLDLPAEIFGRGWDHLAGEGGRAVFHPAVEAHHLPELYSETQFLLNTTPNFSDGAHERVLNGFAAKCCVVSDENRMMRERFAPLPSFFGIGITDPDLPARLAGLYHDGRDRTDDLQPALDLVEREYSGLRFMRSLLELAHELQFFSMCGDFSLSPN